jgi:hypothetical protein
VGVADKYINRESLCLIIGEEIMGLSMFQKKERMLKKAVKTSPVINDQKEKRPSIFDLPDMDLKEAWDIVYEILYATPEFDEKKENALAEVDKFMRWFLFDYNNYWRYEDFKKRRLEEKEHLRRENMENKRK